MYKFLFFFCSLSLLACNNGGTNAANGKDTATTVMTPKAALNADEMEFLTPCVENAKGRLGEQKAYSLCRCIYEQVQQKYPGADSTVLMQHLSDTAEIARMAQKCR